MGAGEGQKDLGGDVQSLALRQRSALEGCCRGVGEGWSRAGVGEGWGRAGFLCPRGVFVQLWLVRARTLPTAGFGLGFLLLPVISKSSGKRKYIFLSHC